MKLRVSLSLSQRDALRVLANRRKTTTTAVFAMAICRNTTAATLREQKVVSVPVGLDFTSMAFSLAPHVYETLYLFACNQEKTMEDCARWLLQQEIDKFLFTT